MNSRHPLLQPRWLVAHALVLTVVIVFPQLGLWQLDRYGEEQDIARRLEERLDAPAAPVTEVLPTTVSDAGADDLEFLPVTATGRYVAEEQVFIRNREFAGVSGYDVLTPLELDDGSAVLVRRGFVPPVRLGADEPSPAPAASGTVTVIGYLETSGAQPGFGPTDPDTGELATMFNADVSRIDAQTAAPLRPMILHLIEQNPPVGAEAPRPQPPPEIDASSNISYAVQWFAFTGIAVIGYAVVLRRKHVEHASARG